MRQQSVWTFRWRITVGLAFLVTGFVSQSLFADYEAHGKRDPFVPLLTAEGQRFRPPGLDEETAPEAGPLVLQGIVYDPQSASYAVINGRVVREQDDIDGKRVLKIEPAEVTLLVEGKTVQLKLRPSSSTEEKSN